MEDYTVFHEGLLILSVSAHLTLSHGVVKLAQEIGWFREFNVDSILSKEVSHSTLARIICSSNWAKQNRGFYSACNLIFAMYMNSYGLFGPIGGELILLCITCNKFQYYIGYFKTR